MLEILLDRDLPPLVWVASCHRDSRVVVRRGSLVEEGPDWLCEAVWSGSFERGEFDRTPLVFGSGVRERDDMTVFVSSGTTVDRLVVWVDSDGRERFVSNSLVHLVAAAGVRPVLAYRQYERDLESIVSGLADYRDELPVSEGQVRLVYFHNLVWDGRRLGRTAKPSLPREFRTFGDYRDFLSETAESIAANTTSADRTGSIELLTTVSSGYDSPAASVISREMGCTRAATIRQARALLPRSDSGHAIGRALGLEVKQYDREPAIGRRELRYWAALGKPQDVNLGVLEYPGSVCLLLTGFHGDKVWTTAEHDTSDNIVRGDTTGLGFTEARLHRGVLHCPVPYWGVRRMDAIARISRAPEMEPWRLGNDYDRPIPRRIVEEAGVPRDAFGQRKSATSAEWRLLPYTPALRQDFAAYVAEATGETITPVSLKHLQARAQRSIDAVKDKWPRLAGALPSVAPRVPALHFHWAVDRLLQESAPGRLPDGSSLAS